MFIQKLIEKCWRKRYIYHLLMSNTRCSLKVYIISMICSTMTIIAHSNVWIKKHFDHFLFLAKFKKLILSLFNWINVLFLLNKQTNKQKDWCDETIVWWYSGFIFSLFWKILRCLNFFGMRISDTPNVRVIKINHLKGLNAPIVVVVFCLSRKIK
jgi:hypothetical protein